MSKPALSTSDAGSAELAAHTAFEAATSLEQQLAILSALLQQKENEYNRNNPTLTPLNRIVMQPDFETSQVNMTIDLLLAPDAVTKSIQESVQEHIPSC